MRLPVRHCESRRKAAGRSNLRRGFASSAFSFLAITLVACARIFGWDIHAPGLLSENFYQVVEPSKERIALYLPPELYVFQSKNRGGRLVDPQTYHVGEALAPMLIEGFQKGFEEFIFLEAEPSQALLKQYAVPRVAVVRIRDFGNRVTLKGQRLELVTETAVLDSDLSLVDKFESRGSSESEKIFAKKGGPEVNLNAAIEQNVRAVVQHLQDLKR